MSESNGLGAMVQHKGIVLTKAEIADLARRAGLTAADLKPPLPRVVKDLGHEIHIERADGQVVRLLRFQDAKYGVLLSATGGGWSGGLANLATGMPVPPDEPVFILRAQDKLALVAIETYCRSVTDNSTAVDQRSGPTAHSAFMAFQQFAQEHPDRMKMPT